MEWGSKKDTAPRGSYPGRRVFQGEVPDGLSDPDG
jgi:hypothetical protein